MNSAQKSKYTKCKYLVKKWESEFKKSKGTNPSKADIKGAPARVKEAYRTYWELKTLQLETSLLDATFDENATDCFIASGPQGRITPPPVEPSPVPSAGDESQFCQPLNDDTHDTMSLSQAPLEGVLPLIDDEAAKEAIFTFTQPKDPCDLPQVTEKETVLDSSEASVDNLHSDSVWGAHVSVAKNDTTKRSLHRSVSFKFAEKLFAKAKFSKRNPRKPLGIKRSNTFNEGVNAASEKVETTEITSCSQPTEEIPGSQESEFDSELDSQGSGHFDLMNQLGKVVIRSAPKVSYQGISAVQSALTGASAPKRRVDAGWLARSTCTAGDDSGVSKGSDSSGPPISGDSSNPLSIGDSSSSITLNTNSNSVATLGEDSNKPQLSEKQKMSPPLQVPVSKPSAILVENPSISSDRDSQNAVLSVESNRVQSDSDSGAEDLVYDSDEDSKSQSSFLTPLMSRLSTSSRLSSSFSGPSISQPSVTLQSRPSCKLSRTQSFSLSSSNIANTGNLCVSNPSSQPSSAKPLSEMSLSNCLSLKSNLTGPIKRFPDPLPNPSKKPRTEPKTKFVPEPVLSSSQTAAVTINKAANERKLTTLRQKVSSGKANENFVKVNIQKKVFVKGKKGMNYSTYKKQKWKSLQRSKGRDSLDSGILKCFKCGDVGHFARQCKAVGDLLPYEEDVDEESLFPTLAEAEESAKAAEATGLVTTKRKKVPVKPRKSTAAVKQTRSQADKTEDNIAEDSEIINEDEMDDLAEAFDEDFDAPAAPPPEEIKPTVEPLYKLNDDGSLPEMPNEVKDALQELGFTSFRKGQEEAVMSILCGRSTLVTLATGAGKSLCYQLPAYMYHKAREGALTLVVSPLVSLMEDQVSCCGGRLEMACLHGNQTEAQRSAVKERLRERKLHVLLVAPEALMADSGGLPSLLPPLAFACIDEAHCLSHWSHNFRPSYLTVCQVLRERLGVKVMMGLTATITENTVDRVLHTLGASRQGLVSSSSRLPENLILTASCDPDKDQALINLLNGERFSQCQSIIIYCTRREVCTSVASYLRINLKDENGDDIERIKGRSRLSTLAEVYHAGLTAAKRKQVQKAFMTGKIRIVVATVAFGMGINKNDIRGVIHYNMPSSMENYVQEVGRAGRDGLVAHCHVFLDQAGGDLCELRRHIHANGVERGTLRKLLSSVLGQRNDEKNKRKLCPSGTCQGHETAFPIDKSVQDLDIPQENISTLLSYLELSCDIGVKSLTPVYVLCRVTSYKGPRHLASVAKTCPPLGVGIAMARSSGAKIGASVHFDVIRASAAIGWDSGIVKRHLKELEWTKTDAGAWTKSGITVELSELGFRLISRCDLAPEECDLALDSLHKSVKDHEQASLVQLQFLHDSLFSVCHKTVTECCDSVDVTRCDKLSGLITSYFMDTQALDGVQVKEGVVTDEEAVIYDIRRLTSMYPDAGFSGRAIARIFHGISSPNYPAPVWGRTRFWRLHLNQDFHALATLATKQLIYLR